MSSFPRSTRTGALGASVPWSAALALVTLALVVTAPTTTAQNGYNEVMRFGVRDLVQTVAHPTTGYPLEIPGAQPAAFMASSTTGVAAGTLTWLWYPSQLNTRYESRQVTGHMVAIRPSSATPLTAYSQIQSGQTLPGVPVYLPKFSIHPAKARAPSTLPFGPGYDPDFSKTPLLTYNTVHTPLVQPQQADQALIWTVTYNTKVQVQSQEMVLAFEWQGGEHASKALSQSLPTSWSESHFAPVHWGWAAPAPGRAIIRFDPKQILPPPSTLDVYTSPMGGYFEDQATICFHSDWGENREPLLANTVYPSYNVGSGLSDVGSSPGKFGWDVYTSAANQGLRAIPLLDFRLAPYPQGIPILGRTVEVDLAGPALTVAWGNPLLDGVITSGGVWLPTSRLPVPALGPSAIGLWVGMEYALADMITGQVPETTQAYWFYIQK